MRTERLAASILGLVLGAAGATISLADAEAIRLREIYVPYSEFRARAGDTTQGVVMTLDEYRGLVLTALAKSKSSPPPQLPPVDAVVGSARYSGALDGKTARFQAALKVRVAVETWVRCDLGTPIPQLGSVTVDGEPGWLIVENANDAKDAPAHAYLLLRGKGDHDVALVFSLGAVEKDDLWSVEGPLAASATSRVELDVPGIVQARSVPPFLDSAFAADRSRLTLAAGSATRFRIEWRRKTAGESDLFLAADHFISYLPRRDSPTFGWRAAVTVARRKTDSLTFTEPPGCTVVKVEGPLVHGWERTQAGLRVVLNEAVEGIVELRFAGVLDAAGDRFILAPPALAAATANTGWLSVEEPAGAKLIIESAAAAVEVSRAESGLPPLEGAAAKGRASRVFAFTDPSARVTVRLAGVDARQESRAAYVLRCGEASATLEGLVRVTAREGRVWQLRLTLPEPWRLVSLEENVANEGDKAKTGHGLRQEESGAAPNRSVRIDLERALEPDEALEIRIRFENGAFGDDRGWDRKPLDLAIPAITNAERTRIDVGIAIPPSMDALMADLPAWRSLSAEEAASIGLSGSVAALTTRDATARLSLTLVHRPARGEYRLVTHLLALEKQLRVRTDIRLAVVDRPIDEVIFRLPAVVGGNAVILGEGIKEVTLDAATGRRTARFSKPWLGTRQFRVEFELAHSAGQAAAIPSIEVEAPAASGGFGSERFVVLQSRGPVELETRAGDGLTPADVDDVPSFSEAWNGGRILTAFRYRPTGDPGTLVTVVHERTPVLKSLARELHLTTVIGREGVSRTRAEILLAYSQESHLSVRLPQGARCLSASVNDSPVRSVRPGTAKEDLAIPLPPQSYARIAIVYEQPDASAPAAPGPLGLAGARREEALVLPDMPVGETIWSIYYPDDYRFVIEGGNARPLDPAYEEMSGSFLDSFIRRALAGRMPIFTSLRPEPPTSKRVPLPPLTHEEMLGAEGSSAKGADQRAVLAPQGAPAESSARERSTAPSYRLIPQGRKVEASKLGGGAVVEIAYRALRFERFARRSVFAGALLLGAGIAIARGRRAFFALVLGGLLAGVALPIALGAKSPLLAVPLCEAFVVLFAAGTVIILLQRLRAIGRPRSAMAAAAIVAFALLTGADASPPATDGVLIPYDPGAPGIAGRGFDKVYIPRGKFLELWKLAHPEQPPVEPAPPAELVLGSAEYRLVIEGDAYRMTGKLPINVLADHWVAFILPFDGQVVKVSLDGSAVGVAQTRLEGSPVPVPFIELKGRGKRLLEVELTGPLVREPGVFKAATRVLAGAAATLTAELPAGAKLESTQPVVAKQDGAKTTAIVDLGGSDRIDLSWSFPKIEGQAASQADSTSYSLLSLSPGGYTIDRIERVRVTGRPLDALEYRVLGAWEVTEVAGAGISAWSVSRDAAAGALRLRVAFAKPMDEAELRVRGRAVLDGTAPLATLSLEGAVRQEAFVGLHHGAGKRFAAQVLQGMLRASREELLAAFSVPKDEVPDRLYHAFKSGEGETIASETVASETTIATTAVVVVTPDRLAVSVKSRYTVTGPGPLRLEVPLAAGWSVRAVQSDALRSWEVVETPNGRVFTVSFKQRAASGTEIVWSADRQLDSLPDPIEVPFVRGVPASNTVTRETLEWSVAASEDLDLSVRSAERLVPVSLETVPAQVELPIGTSYRFAFRSSRADGTGLEPVLRLAASRRSGLLGAAVISLARLAEEALHVNARVIFKARLAGRDRFRIQLPPGAELVSVEARNQRSREVTPAADGLIIEVALQSPITGEQPIDVSYRVPRSGAAPPAILPVRAFDGAARLTEIDQYIGVIQTGANFISAAQTSGLVATETATLPYLPDGIAAASLRPVYRAAQLDWSLALEERLIEVARGPAAVVEIAEITTIVGDDGTARSRAAYTVRNRGLQFLLLEMPEGATLWGVTLNGKPAAVGESPPAAGASSARRTLRVPIEYVGSASLNLEVAVQYEERPLGLPALRGTASLSAPRVVDTQVVETVWNLQFPEGYTISRSGGSLREVAASVLYAKKASNLLEQLEKISKAANESDSQRVREQAAREMGRIEQALGDNLAELTAGNRGPSEWARAGGIGQADIEVQWAANDAIIERSRKAQQGLRQSREDREKAKQAKEPPSKEEQSFLDTTSYLKRGWRDNRDAKGLQAPRSKGAAPGPARPESLEGLLEAPLYFGLDAAEAKKDSDVASPAAVDASRGLKPLPDAAGAGATPGLEAPAARAGGASYTFVNQGGDATLGIAYTRRDAVPRATALAALLLLPAIAFWWARRSRHAGARG